MTNVKGYCPMGCGKTLFVASGGFVTCSWCECPNPGAATDILGISETEHIVLLGEETFTVQHPLRERLNGDLWECRLHSHLVSLNGPPAIPGRYRVYVDGDGQPLTWVAAPAPTSSSRSSTPSRGGTP